MGRYLTSKAHEHFDFITAEDKSVCKLCKEVLKGHHATNLKKHLIRFHNFTESQLAAKTGTIPKKIIKQPAINEINTIKVNISRNMIIDACVELITVNGRPFSIMDDSGFKRILNPIIAGLSMDKQFSLSSESIQKYLSVEASELKQKIIEEIKNRMISMKVDCVTRLDRSFIGINIQYVRNGKINLRTLALKEIKNQHTGENLKNLMIEICHNFQIKEDQIYTITTDNGSNLLKAVKIIASENGEYDVIEVNDETDLLDDTWAENSNIEIVVDNPDKNIGKNELEFDNHSDVFRTLYKTICSNSSNSLSTVSSFKLNVTGMRCAAHTLQLAIEDAFNEDKQVKKIILESRTIVKTLRTQTFMYMLKKQNLKKPIIDCTTRWGSTHDMMKRLQELKDFCTEMELTNFNKFKSLTSDTWSKISDLVSALEPARICTRKLQYEQLTLGTFYGYWQECKLATTKTKSSFAQTLVKCMKKREVQLFDNDVVLAGIFLDPRYKVILNAEEIERAKNHLKQLWIRLLTIRETGSLEIENQGEPLNTSNGSSNNSNDDLEIFLKKKETENNIEQGLHNSQTLLSQPQLLSRKIDNILNSYNIEQNRVRLPNNVTIITFWENKKDIYPELYLLAQVLLAVPATQVSVERLFSGLKFLLPASRSNIRDKILEEQLFVRTNRIFEHNEKQLFTIKKMPKEVERNEKIEEDEENITLETNSKKRPQQNNLNNYFKKTCNQ